MSELNTPKGVSRRTIAKGAAWTVPAIAVAGAAPAMAASPSEPPPPGFDWDNAVKNPGNSCTITNCVAFQSYGVPVTASNPTDQNLVIRFTDYKTEAAPDGTGGISRGVHNVGVVYGPPLNSTSCANRVSSCSLPACASATNSVCVAPGETFTFWVFSNSAGSSANVSQFIPWEWIDPSDDCAVVLSSGAYSPTSPPNDAC